MKPFLKIFIGALILVGGFFTLNYLQYRFDKADLRNAIDAVRLTKSSGEQDRTIEEKIIKQYQVESETIFWMPEFDSKFQGTVLVKAKLSDPKIDLKWRVDLVRFEVIPISQDAIFLGKSAVPPRVDEEDLNFMEQAEKQNIIRLLNNLPENATYDDFMYELYVLEKIRKGMEDGAAGRTISHEEIKKRFLDNEN